MTSSVKRATQRRPSRIWSPSTTRPSSAASSWREKSRPANRNEKLYESNPNDYERSCPISRLRQSSCRTRSRSTSNASTTSPSSRPTCLHLAHPPSTSTLTPPPARLPARHSSPPRQRPSLSLPQMPPLNSQIRHHHPCPMPRLSPDKHLASPLAYRPSSARLACRRSTTAPRPSPVPRQPLLLPPDSPDHDCQDLDRKSRHQPTPALPRSAPLRTSCPPPTRSPTFAT